MQGGVGSSELRGEREWISPWKKGKLCAWQEPFARPRVNRERRHTSHKVPTFIDHTSARLHPWQVDRRFRNK